MRLSRAAELARAFASVSQHLQTSCSHQPRQERQTWGSRFHLLMQRELGLPIRSLIQQDTQLQSWMTAFASAAPEILTPDINSQTFRESEHCTLQIQIIC